MDLVEEELICCVCLDLYDTPVLLPCSHTLCKKCARGLSDTSTITRRIFDCPKCRQEVRLSPALGLDSLPENLSLRNLVDIVRRQKREAKQRQGIAEKSCPKHGLELCYYCRLCHQIVCTTCVKEAHSGFGHVVSEVKDVLEEEQEKADVCKAELKRYVGLLESQQQKVLKKKERLANFERNVQKSLDYDFQQLILAANMTKLKLFSDIQKILKTERDSVCREETRCRDLAKDVSQLTKLLETSEATHDMGKKLKKLEKFVVKETALMTFKLSSHQFEVDESFLPVVKIKGVEQARKALDMIQWSNTTTEPSCCQGNRVKILPGVVKKSGSTGDPNAVAGTSATDAEDLVRVSSDDSETKSSQLLSQQTSSSNETGSLSENLAAQSNTAKSCTNTTADVSNTPSPFTFTAPTSTSTTPHPLPSSNQVSLLPSSLAVHTQRPDVRPTPTTTSAGSSDQRSASRFGLLLCCRSKQNGDVPQSLMESPHARNHQSTGDNLTGAGVILQGTTELNVASNPQTVGTQDTASIPVVSSTNAPSALSSDLSSTVSTAVPELASTGAPSTSNMTSGYIPSVSAISNHDLSSADTPNTCGADVPSAEVPGVPSVNVPIVSSADLPKTTSANLAVVGVMTGVPSVGACTAVDKASSSACVCSKGSGAVSKTGTSVRNPVSLSDAFKAISLDQSVSQVQTSKYSESSRWCGRGSPLESSDAVCPVTESNRPLFTVANNHDNKLDYQALFKSSCNHSNHSQQQLFGISNGAKPLGGFAKVPLCSQESALTVDVSPRETLMAGRSDFELGACGGGQTETSESPASPQSNSAVRKARGARGSGAVAGGSVSSKGKSSVKNGGRRYHTLSHHDDNSAFRSTDYYKSVSDPGSPSRRSAEPQSQESPAHSDSHPSDQEETSAGESSKPLLLKSKSAGANGGTKALFTIGVSVSPKSAKRAALRRINRPQNSKSKA